MGHTANLQSRAQPRRVPKPSVEGIGIRDAEHEPSSPPERHRSSKSRLPLGIEVDLDSGADAGAQRDHAVAGAEVDRSRAVGRDGGRADEHTHEVLTGGKP